MGVVALISGLAVFFAGHAMPMAARRRAALARRIGDGTVKLIVSAISLIGLLLTIWGFANRPIAPVWSPPIWTQHLTLTLMIPAMILLAAAYLPRGKVRAATRHPMLLAVKIWAVAHLIANGDLWAMVMFLAFLLWAGADRASVAKRDRAAGVTRDIAGASLVWDVAAIGVGLGAYAAFALYLHPAWIGVAVWPQ